MLQYLKIEHPICILFLSLPSNINSYDQEIINCYFTIYLS